MAVTLLRKVRPMRFWVCSRLLLGATPCLSDLCAEEFAKNKHFALPFIYVVHVTRRSDRRKAIEDSWSPNLLNHVTWINAVDGKQYEDVYVMGQALNFTVVPGWDLSSALKNSGSVSGTTLSSQSKNKDQRQALLDSEALFVEAGTLKKFKTFVPHHMHFWTRELLPGEAGCTMSHFGIWQKIAKLHYDSRKKESLADEKMNITTKYAIVVEDDVRLKEREFCKSLYDIHTILDKYAPDWDFLDFGLNQAIARKPAGEEDDGELPFFHEETLHSWLEARQAKGEFDPGRKKKYKFYKKYLPVRTNHPSALYGISARFAKYLIHDDNTPRRCVMALDDYFAFMRNPSRHPRRKEFKRKCWPKADLSQPRKSFIPLDFDGEPFSLVHGKPGHPGEFLSTQTLSIIEEKAQEL